MNKKCKKCLKIKPLNKFVKNKQCNLGYASKCIECLKLYNKKNYLLKKDKILASNKIWWETNKEYHRKKVNEYDKIYRQRKDVKKRRAFNSKQRRNESIQQKLMHNLRSRLNSAIKWNCKKGSAVKDLGCSIDFLKFWLESKFQPGMNWNNWGNKGWHIDHIIPLSKVNLTDRNELLKVCHYTNLQPLWYKENIRKGNKQETKESESK